MELKKSKNKLKLIIFVSLFSGIVLFNNSIYANILKPVEYTEEYKQWIELKEENKTNRPVLRKYEVKHGNVSNILRTAGVTRDAFSSEYKLQDDIPENIIVRDQKSASQCWAFASMAVLESNLALRDLKENKDVKEYDFSERHMDYGTAINFLNNEKNEYGYRKNIKLGGDWNTSEMYLTNGMGAILEEEMPFVEEQGLIEISEIKGKQVQTKVEDTIYFEVPPNSNTLSTEFKTWQRKLKQHIIDNGGIYAGVYWANKYDSKAIGSYYCNNADDEELINHAVTIVGWNDEYSVDNFTGAAKPKNPGAWLVKNSWGTSYPNKGFWYISYEDVGIHEWLYGIQSAKPYVDYENIYQHDIFGCTELMTNESITDKKVYLANVFEKKTDTVEKLSEVSILTYQTYKCKVYVNPNGSSKAKKDLIEVKLKAGEYEIIEPGYHTLEFEDTIDIKGNCFVVVVEVEMPDAEEGGIIISVEKSDEIVTTATANAGESYMAVSNETGELYWNDIGEEYDANLCIKAFTSLELENIRVAKSPNKVDYIKGENFDGAGMIVMATIHGEEKEITDYIIVNGNNLKSEQTSVTINYKGREVNVPILVREELYIHLKKYTIEIEKGTNYIKGISINETVQDLLNQIETNGQITWISNSLVETDTKLATGMELKITLNNETTTYKLVVRGDVTGEGKVDLSDLVLLARYVARTDKNVDSIRLKAMEVNNKDNKNIVDMSDLVIMARYVAKNIASI